MSVPFKPRVGLTGLAVPGSLAGGFVFLENSSRPMRKQLLASALTALALLAPVAADDFLVPLDDRPANRLFVEQVARIGRPQERLQVVPRHLLGRLLTPGESDAVVAWTLAQAKPGDTVVVCVDMWLYGGLVASRSASATPEVVGQRLEQLRALSEKGVKLHVIATIPRLSLRTSDTQAPHERALANWAAKDGLPTAQAMLDASDSAPFPESVPRPVVEEYLGVRVRNLQTLLSLVDMASEGLFESLVLGQDDANKTGIHVEEQARLRERIAASPQASHITLLSGIDELSMNVVAGLLADRSKHHPTVRVIYSDPEAADKIPPMESLTLDEMVREHLVLSGARAVETDTADVDLYVYVPYEKPYALPGEEKRSGSEEFVDTVERAMKGGRRVAVADLSLINRMDPFLAEAVLKDVRLPELEGFASWNTPANAVGTVIAQLVCHRIAETSPTWNIYDRLEAEKTHQAFLFARMIDDYGYQTIVRDAVKGQTDGLSATADPLLNLFGPVGVDIRLRLVQWARETFAAHYQGTTICLEPQERLVRFRDARLEVVLPWPRIFEVEARLDLRLEDTGKPCKDEKEPVKAPSRPAK